MKDSTLATNLGFACSLFPSIADFCRRVGINRQQFNKYLAGDVRPSRHNMHRICEFIGVTESELLSDPERFADLISLRRAPKDHTTAPFWARAIARLGRASGSLERYLGCYYRYFYAFGYPGRITRSFCVISRGDEGYFWKNLELSQDGKLSRTRSVGKYEGIAFLLGDRIQIVEYEALMCSSVTQLVLYPAYHKGFAYLRGLQTGGSLKRGRKPAASTVLLEYLGRDVDPRRALARCGIFEEARIDSAIREMIRNEIPPGAFVFEVEEL